MAVMQQQTEINSVDISAYVVEFEIERVWGDAIAQAEIRVVKTIANSLTLENGQTVNIYRGWTNPNDELVFSGYVESFEPDAGSIKITCKDKAWDLIRKEVTHTYDKNIDASAGNISEIFKDLVETYGGLTAEVQDSGTLLILDKFVCNHTDIFERCKALATTLDWQFYYRADTDKVYFEPKGYTENSTILTVGDNVYGVPKWNYDTSETANDLTVVGAKQEIETTESGQIGVTADYTTTSILLSFEPISVKLYMDAGNPPTTLKVGGIPGSTSSYFYSVDKDNKQVLPAESTTFTGNHFAEIRYSHAVPIPVHMYSQASIDAYGQFKKTITYNDIRSIEDAEARGNNYLLKYSIPFINATLKVKNDSSYGLNVGDLIRVVDNISEPVVDKLLVISRYRIRYPASYDEVLVGDKSWRISEWQSSVEERLKRLLEGEIANQDIVVELLTFDNTQVPTLNPINHSPRYFQVNYQSLASDGLIWGNVDFGTWNSFKWAGTATISFVLGHSSAGILGTSLLGSTTSSETNHFIRQYQNFYTEDFHDDDFKSGNTTADWDNTNKWVDFTAGEIAESSSIDYNNGTITTAKLTSTEDSGSFDYEMTADGTNWEAVTSGTAHTFSDTGTDLRWRATENAASTGKINEIKVENYH